MKSQTERLYIKTGIPRGDQLLKLTPRQIEVLKLVAKGKTNMLIAEELGLSEKTIKNHRYNICCKLGIKGRNGLYRFALRKIGLSQNGNIMRTT